MQGPERLACEYTTFEEAWANLENAAQGVMDELARAQQHQARCQDEVKGCRDGLDDIVKDLANFRAFLEAACDDLADACMKTTDLKRKADDAHDRTRSHRDWCRRAKELTKAEEAINNTLGCFGDLVKSATHALSSVVRESYQEFINSGKRHMQHTDGI